jgi:hypothetical protein
MSIPAFIKCESDRQYIPVEVHRNKRTRRYHATARGIWRVVSLPKPRNPDAVKEALTRLAKRSFADLWERRVKASDDIRIECVEAGKLYYLSARANTEAG